MVGSGASDRSKEAIGMMALHEALRSVCLNSDWTYSVFWTIRPRPYVCLFFSLISFAIVLFFTWVFAIFTGELEVVMVVKLETTMVACEYASLSY